MENTAAAKLDWIKARLAEGRTVYLQTSAVVTPIKAKHADLVRVRGNSLEVCRGSRWIDYSWARVPAR